MSDTARSTSGRRRNPRGMGKHLADEIVAGALALIDDEGTAEAVTLRAVAREVGISAPSIYAHFHDREEILLAVARHLFDDIHTQLTEARDNAGEDPVSRLIAGCRAYVTFGLENPARYGALFSCDLGFADGDAPGATLDDFSKGKGLIGAEAFLVLVDSLEDCVRGGVSQSIAPAADAIAIWLYLHGLVSLHNGLEGFPWPPATSMVEETVRLLARLQPVGRRN